MDEQLKRELQEALYGALAAIYQSNAENRRDKEDQEQKIEIIVSGDSLSLIKAISEENELDNKIAKVASSFELLNGQLREFNKLDDYGIEGSFAMFREAIASLSIVNEQLREFIEMGGFTADGTFTKFADFLRSLAGIPNIERLDKDHGKDIASFISSISKAIQKIDIEDMENGLKPLEEMMSLLSLVTNPDWLERLSNASDTMKSDTAKNIIDFIKGIADGIREIDAKATIKGLPDVASIIAFVDLYTSEEWIDKIAKATKKLEKNNHAEVLKSFFKTIASIFNDDEIKKVYLDNPNIAIQGEGMQGILALLNFITQDGFFMKMTRANIAMRLTGAKTIKRFFKTIGSIFNDPDIVSASFEETEARTKGIYAVIKLLETVASVKFLTKIMLAAAVLNEKRGKSIAEFFNGFVNTLSSSKSAEEIEAASKALKSMSVLIDSLTKSIILVVGISILIAAINPISTLTTMAIVVAMEIGLVWSILKLASSIDGESAMKSIEAINKIMENLSFGLFMLGVVSVMIQLGGGYRSWMTTMSLMLLYVVSVGALAFAAAAITTISDQAVEGVKAMSNLVKSLGIGMLAIAATGAIIKNFGTSFLATLGYLVITVLLIGGIALALSYYSGPVKQGEDTAKNLAKLVLAIGICLLLVGAIGFIMQYIDMANVTKAAGLLIGVMIFGAVIAAIMRNQGADMMKGMIGLGALIIAIGATVFLIGVTSLLAAQIKWEDLGKTALIFAAVIGVTLGIAFVIKTWGGEMMKGVAWLAVLMLGIGINVVLLAAATRLVEGISFDSVWKILAILGGEIIALGIVALITKIPGVDKAKWNMLILEAMLLGLVLNVALVALVTRAVEEISWESLGKVGLIILAQAGIALAIGYAASIMNKTGITKDMIVLELCLAGILGIIWGTIKVMKMADEYGGFMDILEGLGKIGEIFGGISVMAGVIGIAAWAAIPAIAGLAILEPFLAGLLLITWGFVKIIKSYKDANIDFAASGKELGDGINAFIDNFASFGNAAKLAAIGAVMYFFAVPLTGMMIGLGLFVKLVKDVATMNFITGYDDNGKPIYERVAPTVFGEAATKVAEGFSAFLNGLHKGFSSFSLKSAAIMTLLSASIGPVTKSVGDFVDAVMKLASGKYLVGEELVDVTTSQFETAAGVVSEQFKVFLQKLSDGFGSLGLWSVAAIKLVGENMNPVMESVSSFTDAILKLATGQYITGYDANGNPEYARVDKSEYSEAAKVITENFGSFLRTLIEESNNLKWSSESSIESISDAIMPVMKGVSEFVDAIMKVATGTWITGYDENGKPTYEKITSAQFSLAARQITGYFLGFVRKMIEMSDGMSDDTQRAIKSLSKSIGPLMSSVGSFADALVKMGTSTYIVGYDENGKAKYMTVDPSVYSQAATTLAKGMSDFVQILTEQIAPIEEQSAKTINKITKGGLKNLIDAVAKFSKVLTDNMFVITGYDDNGKPIFEKGKDGKPVLTSSYYPSIATSLGVSFGMFLTILDLMLTPLVGQAESLGTTIGKIKVVFDPLAKFTKALDEYKKTFDSLNKDGQSINEFSRGIGETLKAFLEGMFGEDIVKYGSEENLKTVENLKKSVDKSVATVLLMSKLAGIDIKKIIENIIGFQEALNSLLSVDIPQKAQAFSGGVESIKTTLKDLQDTTNGMPAVITGMSNVMLASAVVLQTGTFNVLAQLTKFDNGIKNSVNHVLKFRTTFTETIDKIEDKLKKNEGQRNKMLKDLTDHLDTIGTKLKIISEGLVNINNASMDKVEKLAQVFAEIQNNTIRVMAEQGVFNQQNSDNSSSAASAPDQTAQQNNSFMVNQQDQRPDNYFGKGMVFEIREGGQGFVKGLLKEMT